MVFIDWFWPGYLAGGPVQSIVSLVGYLGSEFNFKIVTTNRDLNSTKAYPGLKANEWVKSDLGCEVYYSSDPNVGLIEKILKETDYDLVYINSFFSKYFSIVPLQVLKRMQQKRPVVLAPRGMLGEGALALKKWKKKVFIAYAKLTGLHKNVIWHATSLQEEREIRAVFPHTRRVFTISNLPKKLQVTTKPTKTKGELNLCFISRISEKKNLLFALRILANVKEGKITYNIFGPREDGEYWALCQEVIKTLPPHISVFYKGSIDPSDLEKQLSQHHMMFLPTMNENFGHSIVESLMCGCPVIISDQTPWLDLEAHHAGYAIPLARPDKFTEVLEKCLDMTQEEFSEWSLAANKYISERINLNQITDQYKQLFYDPA